jgi:hypothetical protein
MHTWGPAVTDLTMWDTNSVLEVVMSRSLTVAGAIAISVAARGSQPTDTTAQRTGSETPSMTVTLQVCTRRCAPWNSRHATWMN